MERIAKTRFAFACAFICMVLFFCMHSCISCVNVQNKRMKAYEGLLHRVYLDNPVYVDDVLSETDAFQELDASAKEKIFNE